MVTLKNDKSIFRSSAAGARSLQFRPEIWKVNALCVYALYYRRSLTPFPGLKTDLDKLLFHTNGSADTQILREPTSGANVSHNLIQLLLFVVPISVGQYLNHTSEILLLLETTLISSDLIVIAPF